MKQVEDQHPDHPALKSRRDLLQSDEKRIMIIVDFGRLMWWAKSYVYQVLGRPQKMDNRIWTYPNKEIHFEVYCDHWHAERLLKGWHGAHMTFGGEHSDAMLGIKR